MYKAKKLMMIIIIAGVFLFASACGKTLPGIEDKISFDADKKLENRVLITDASPETSALTLYEYDGTVVRGSWIYDVKKEWEIINYINSVEISFIENVDISKLEGNMYGIDIGRKDGTLFLGAWLDGYWIADDGTVYQVDIDFRKIKKYFDAEEDQYGLSIFPNIYYLAMTEGKWNENFLQESARLNQQDLKLEITELTNENITVKLTNRSNTEFMYGEIFDIQVELNGIWYNIPRKEQIMFLLIGYMLKPEESANKTYNIVPYGELPAGHYRIVVNDSFVDFSLENTKSP